MARRAAARGAVGILDGPPLPLSSPPPSPSTPETASASASASTLAAGLPDLTYLPPEAVVTMALAALADVSAANAAAGADGESSLSPPSMPSMPSSGHSAATAAATLRACCTVDHPIQRPAGGPLWATLVGPLPAVPPPSTAVPAANGIPVYEPRPAAAAAAMTGPLQKPAAAIVGRRWAATAAVLRREAGLGGQTVVAGAGGVRRDRRRACVVTAGGGLRVAWLLTAGGQGWRIGSVCPRVTGPLRAVSPSPTTRLSVVHGATISAVALHPSAGGGRRYLLSTSLDGGVALYDLAAPPAPPPDGGGWDGGGSGGVGPTLGESHPTHPPVGVTTNLGLPPPPAVAPASVLGGPPPPRWARRSGGGRRGRTHRPTSPVRHYAPGTARRHAAAPASVTDAPAPDAPAGVTAVSWYPPDAGLFVTLSVGGVLKAWDTTTLLPAAAVTTPPPGRAAAISVAPGGRPDLVAVAGGGVGAGQLVLVDLTAGGVAGVLGGEAAATTAGGGGGGGGGGGRSRGSGPPGLGAISWSPTHPHMVAAASAGGGVVRLFDVRRSGDSAVVGVLDGLRVARGLEAGADAVVDDGDGDGGDWTTGPLLGLAATVGEPPTGGGDRRKRRRRLSAAAAHGVAADPAGVADVAWSGDGRWFFTRGSGGLVKWDPLSGHRLPPAAGWASLGARTAGGNGGRGGMVVGGDGETLYVADGTGVAVVDVPTGAAVGRLTGHWGRVTALGGGGQGEVLVSAGEDLRVVVWEPPTVGWGGGGRRPGGSRSCGGRGRRPGLGRRRPRLGRVSGRLGQTHGRHVVGGGRRGVGSRLACGVTRKSCHAPPADPRPSVRWDSRHGSRGPRRPRRRHAGSAEGVGCRAAPEPAQTVERHGYPRRRR
ncbi:hypothetical protein MMPV_003307 [Pyropia vietnamensis]